MPRVVLPLLVYTASPQPSETQHNRHAESPLALTDLHNCNAASPQLGSGLGSIYERAS
jgi:hypothetical protein